MFSPSTGMLHKDTLLCRILDWCSGCPTDLRRRRSVTLGPNRVDGGVRRSRIASSIKTDPGLHHLVPLLGKLDQEFCNPIVLRQGKSPMTYSIIGLNDSEFVISFLTIPISAGYLCLRKSLFS